MRISLIINTAAGDPYIAARRNPFRSATYGDRRTTLSEILADFAHGFDEIIVAGVVPNGLPQTTPVTRIVNVAPIYRDRRDALVQREVGARHASGDILVFTHDDHAPAPGFASSLLVEPDGWDLLIPQRVHGVTEALLNNGAADDYMGGHLLVMRRWLWAAVPWTKLNTEFWDVPMTHEWRAAGARLVWTDRLSSIDLEASASES